jgi:hypothetical protein
VVVAVILCGGQGAGGEQAHQQHCTRNLGGHLRGLQDTQDIQTRQRVIQ